MRYEIRPLGPWPEPVTTSRGSSSTFRASWPDTLALLGREVELLDGTLLVLQVDVTEGEIRRDGMLRTNARAAFPGVRVSFGSRHGPLTYATDQYDRPGALPGWQANVRAIALALQALRAVDRYGVTGRGEQYTGWRAIEAPSAAAPAMTVRQAAAFIVEHAGLPPSRVQLVIENALERRNSYRMAAHTLHPDRGGDHDQMALLTIAKQVLDAADPTTRTNGGG